MNIDPKTKTQPHVAAASQQSGVKTMSDDWLGKGEDLLDCFHKLVQVEGFGKVASNVMTIGSSLQFIRAVGCDEHGTSVWVRRLQFADQLQAVPPWKAEIRNDQVKTMAIYGC